MSYRAFKRLLGETSLERKCRFLFGAGILVLITASFWLYAYQTEHLAYNQTTTTCRLLIYPVIAKEHLSRLGNARPKEMQAFIASLGEGRAKLKKELARLLEETENQGKTIRD